MIYPLPSPIPANYSYDAVRVEDMRYDESIPGYTASVFGVSGGQPMPLIFRSGTGTLHRVTEAKITDDEIKTVMDADPSIHTVLDAAFRVAMSKLGALVQA
jgi:hypothetical protein